MVFFNFNLSLALYTSIHYANHSKDIGTKYKFLAFAMHQLITNILIQ